MEKHPDGQHKTVPPIKIKNVRSLQTVHVSDDDDSGSTSENDNLQIDETYDPVVIKEEPFIIEHDNMEIVEQYEMPHRTARKKIRAPKPNDSDSVFVIDGDTMGTDQHEQGYHDSATSNRHSVNSEESVTNSGSLARNTSGHSSKGNRRKSHHVPKQVGDVVFEEATILTVDDEDDDDDAGTSDDPNRNLMKNIAMLKTCINYVLENQNCRTLSFKHNYDSTAKMIEHYKQSNNKY
ncbi:uncharacterized protein LOC134216302 [Armigeres subalbatus]|uniref:uncharacterized protein LOC134216302 n=1 Tax=Armigeres subalbatus TaxID=124917 RepID=UPI002ED1FBF3